MLALKCFWYNFNLLQDFALGQNIIQLSNIKQSASNQQIVFPFLRKKSKYPLNFVFAKSNVTSSSQLPRPSCIT